MSWPCGLIQECEQEVGMPMSNEDVCFTSQAGGSLKAENDLRYGESVDVNSFTQNLWIELYPAMPKDWSCIAKNSWVSTK